MLKSIQISFQLSFHWKLIWIDLNIPILTILHYERLTELQSYQWSVESLIFKAQNTQHIQK